MKAALNHGDNVAAVGRSGENSMKQMQGWHERCLGLLCDVRVRETVRQAVEGCIGRFGGFDVVVKYVWLREGGVEGWDTGLMLSVVVVRVMVS